LGVQPGWEFPRTLANWPQPRFRSPPPSPPKASPPFLTHGARVFPQRTTTQSSLSRKVGHFQRISFVDFFGLFLVSSASQLSRSKYPLVCRPQREHPLFSFAVKLPPFWGFVPPSRLTRFGSLWPSECLASQGDPVACFRPVVSLIPVFVFLVVISLGKALCALDPASMTS